MYLNLQLEGHHTVDFSVKYMFPIDLVVVE